VARVVAAHAPAARAARKAVAVVARKAVLKVGAAKGRKAGKGLAASFAEVVGRGAARVTNVLEALTGTGGKRRRAG
jgi:hypothetical protein